MAEITVRVEVAVKVLPAPFKFFDANGNELIQHTITENDGVVTNGILEFEKTIESPTPTIKITPVLSDKGYCDKSVFHDEPPENCCPPILNHIETVENSSQSVFQLSGTDSTELGIRVYSLSNGSENTISELLYSGQPTTSPDGIIAIDENQLITINKESFNYGSNYHIEVVDIAFAANNSEPCKGSETFSKLKVCSIQVTIIGTELTDNGEEYLLAVVTGYEGAVVYTVNGEGRLPSDTGTAQFNEETGRLEIRHEITHLSPTATYEIEVRETDFENCKATTTFTRKPCEIDVQITSQNNQQISGTIATTEGGGDVIFTVREQGNAVGNNIASYTQNLGASGDFTANIAGLDSTKEYIFRFEEANNPSCFYEQAFQPTPCTLNATLSASSTNEIKVFNISGNVGNVLYTVTNEQNEVVNGWDGLTVDGSSLTLDFTGLPTNVYTIVFEDTNDSACTNLQTVDYKSCDDLELSINTAQSTDDQLVIDVNGNYDTINYQMKNAGGTTIREGEVTNSSTQFSIDVSGLANQTYTIAYSQNGYSDCSGELVYERTICEESPELFADCKQENRTSVDPNTFEEFTVVDVSIEAERRGVYSQNALLDIIEFSDDDRQTWQIKNGDTFTFEQNPTENGVYEDKVIWVRWMYNSDVEGCEPKILYSKATYKPMYARVDFEPDNTVDFDYGDLKHYFLHPNGSETDVLKNTEIVDGTAFYKISITSSIPDNANTNDTKLRFDARQGVIFQSRKQVGNGTSVVLGKSSGSEFRFIDIGKGDGSPVVRYEANIQWNYEGDEEGTVFKAQVQDFLDTQINSLFSDSETALTVDFVTVDDDKTLKMRIKRTPHRLFVNSPVIYAAYFYDPKSSIPEEEIENENGSGISYATRHFYREITTGCGRLGIVKTVQCDPVYTPVPKEIVGSLGNQTPSNPLQYTTKTVTYEDGNPTKYGRSETDRCQKIGCEAMTIENNIPAPN